MMRIEEGAEKVTCGEITLCRVGSGGENGYEVLDRRSLGGVLEVVEELKVTETVTVEVMEARVVA